MKSHRWLICSVAIAIGGFGSIACAHAAGFQTLYSFCSRAGCSDGASPRAGVILDANGNMYGTTWYGGDGCSRSSCGVVFRLGSDGSETVLLAFNGVADGNNPETSLIRDGRGDLFGTTRLAAGDCGTVFRLSARGQERVLHTFQGGADGCLPSGPLMEDGAGNLFGETGAGGGTGCNGNGCGIVYKIAPDGTMSTLYTFSGSDGASPDGGLVQDASGNFYGTTYGSSCYYRCGTVFALTPDGTETVLHAFGKNGDGFTPLAGVIRDGEGNLYGTTEYGGADGLGTVFKVGSDGTESVLYSFQGTGAHDGAVPAGGLVEDAAGNLFGTTEVGGNRKSACHSGCGTVFKLDSNGVETVLYRFSGGKDGSEPLGTLAADREGHLYGTVSRGHHGGVFTIRK